MTQLKIISEKVCTQRQEEKKTRFPPWLKRKLPKGSQLFKTTNIVEKFQLNTVCEEAKCPNRMECYSKKTATFLALGKECTRNCAFCDIDFSKTPKLPEKDEPLRIARSVQELNLKHVVITMVARDDLEDKGASHIAQIIRTVRKENPLVTIEVLTSDFSADLDALSIVLKESPEIFNHNIESVARISPKIRHKASYETSLRVLSYAKSFGKNFLIKSGIMVGLGETDMEVFSTLADLQKVGCDIVTIGQYLQASKNKVRVKEFVSPETFALYKKRGEEIGIPFLYAGPFVRSSYNAEFVLKKVQTGFF